MAAKSKKMYLIIDGPSLLELQFSDYNREGHVVKFRLEETSPQEHAKGLRLGERSTMGCQVTGSDRVESIMRDALGREIPGGARLIRVQVSIFRYEGWYKPGSPREGLLVEIPIKIV